MIKVVSMDDVKWAMKTYRRFKRWNTGKLEEWSQTDRVPPREVLRHMYDIMYSGLQYMHQQNSAVFKIDTQKGK